MIFITSPWGLDHSGMDPIKITATTARKQGVSMLPAFWKKKKLPWEKPFITFNKVASKKKLGGSSLNSKLENVYV